MAEVTGNQRTRDHIVAIMRKRREYLDEAHSQIQALEKQRREFEEKRRRHEELLKEFEEMRRYNNQMVERISAVNPLAPPAWRDTYNRLLIW